MSNTPQKSSIAEAVTGKDRAEYTRSVMSNLLVNLPERKAPGGISGAVHKELRNLNPDHVLDEREFLVSLDLLAEPAYRRHLQRNLAATNRSSKFRLATIGFLE